MVKWYFEESGSEGAGSSGGLGTAGELLFMSPASTLSLNQSGGDLDTSGEPHCTVKRERTVLLVWASKPIATLENPIAQLKWRTLKGQGCVSTEISARK